MTFGVLALILGGAMLLCRKGTLSHRRIGRAYTLSMVGMLFTSFLIYRLFGHFGPFHILSVISFVTLAAGFLPAWTRRPSKTWLQRHYQYMSYSYAGLVAATAAEIAVRVPGSPFAIGAFLSSVVVMIIATVLIRAYREPTISPFINK